MPKLNRELVVGARFLLDRWISPPSSLTCCLDSSSSVIQTALESQRTYIPTRYVTGYKCGKFQFTSYHNECVIFSPCLFFHSSGEQIGTVPDKSIAAGYALGRRVIGRYYRYLGSIMYARHFMCQNLEAAAVHGCLLPWPLSCEKCVPADDVTVSCMMLQHI